MVTALPPFRLIARELRDDIAKGRLVPDQRLPSENQLSERYGTTRATVRKAIALLRAEGLVVSAQGRGAFVRPRPRVKMLLTGAHYRENRESGVANFSAEAAAQGRHAIQKLLEVGEIRCPDDIAERLAVETGTPVIVRKRLFVVDDVPMQLCDGYYLSDLFRGTRVAEPRLVPGGVHAVIEDPDGPLRARVTRFVEDLDARLPSPAETEMLQIPDGVPVMRVLRTAYDADDRPLEVLDSVIPTDRHAFRYVIDVP